LKPERWQEISRIFKSALSVDPDARAAFIQRQCGTDESLRKQIEELVESHQRATAEAFIAGGAAHDAAGLVVHDEEEQGRRSVLEDGQTFGSYLILGTLGAGGMGEVYLAKDLRLDRTVALKILPPEVAADQRRMQRFRQEARVASSLNQPNILTIYEFGEVDSRHFLASEYIDGETLRDLTHGRQLKLSEILDISIQILTAIEAAHEAKIVHRDIKPENVMIRRRDRIVKVLDFGLAKLTEKAPSSVAESSLEAATQFKTAAGSVLGTVSYMSPEQAQGLHVDERTDIWSAGVMIYEMVAGTLPFKGLTSSHVIVQIIEKDPLLLTQLKNVNVPAELQRIVSKSMAKDAEERYQTAKDMLIDLRSLKRRLDLDREIDRSRSATTNRVPMEDEARARKKVSSSPKPATHQARSPERNKLARSRSSITILGAALAVVVLSIAAVFGINAWRSSRVGGLQPSSSLPIFERTLNYWMTVQKFRDGKPYKEPFDLPAEINFETDYQVRLNVSSPQGGYLYVLNEGPIAGRSLQILFPSSTANNGSALLPQQKPVQIPERSWFKFDSEQGAETIWLIFSASAIPELEALKRFTNQTDQGVINNTDLNRAAKLFIQAKSTAMPIVEKSDSLKQTSIRSSASVLVYAIKLAHN
jgi:serine/threonine protein kinase